MHFIPSTTTLSPTPIFSLPVDDSVFASFDENNGSGQQFSLSLADSSVVAVSYDESTNSISIGSENIGVGESVVVDGIKCTVVSF